LAVLSSMAEIPERVYSRFITKEVNAAGIYLVTLFVNGYEFPVILDDYFPVVGNRPAFCSSKEGEIWAMLLEKAWAKLYGSYMRTEGGQTAHATQHLMGYPAHTYDHKNIQPAQFWKELVEFDKRNYVMLTSSNSGTNEET